MLEELILFILTFLLIFIIYELFLVRKAKKDKRKLSQLGCSVDILKYDDEFKDAGDYINHPEKLKLLKHQLKLRVLGLCKGTVLAV